VGFTKSYNSLKE